MKLIALFASMVPSTRYSGANVRLLTSGAAMVFSIVLPMLTAKADGFDDYRARYNHLKEERSPVAPTEEQCAWIKGVPAKKPDIKKIVEDIRRQVRSKDQYETVEEYEGRAEMVIAALLPANHRLWASTPISQGRGSYDLQGETLTFDQDDIEGSMVSSMVVSTDLGGSLYPERYEGVIANETNSRLGGYIGQNVFGAATQVTVSDLTDYGIGFLSPDYDRGLAHSNLHINIHLDPATARSVRPLLELVVGGDVTTGWKEKVGDEIYVGYVWTDQIHKDATLDDPLEGTLRTNLIIVSNPCGMIRNSVTGDVLAVFGLGAIKPHL